MIQELFAISYLQESPASFIKRPLTFIYYYVLLLPPRAAVVAATPLHPLLLLSLSIWLVIWWSLIFANMPRWSQLAIYVVLCRVERRRASTLSKC